jgi:hypothetical protein
LYSTHSHASESLHSGSLPTCKDEPPAVGVPRKLAGRSPGAANRHPSGTLLCLHVSKPGSDGLELTPLLPLDATRSSPCRRLGYIVTEGPAMTSNPSYGPATGTDMPYTAASTRPQPCLQQLTRPTHGPTQPGGPARHHQSKNVSTALTPDHHGQITRNHIPKSAHGSLPRGPGPTSLDYEFGSDPAPL